MPSDKRDTTGIETDADRNTRRAHKVLRKRRKKQEYAAKLSSCSCSVDSSEDESNCCCCSSVTLSCSSSDSDERFARYYKLSSDEFELRGVDFPVESKKKRREMTKLLLHTMVMWDDIWKSKVSDVESTMEDSSSSSSVEGDMPQMVRRGRERYSKKTDSLKDLTVSRRLKQTLALKQDHGVFFSGKWYGLPIEEIDPFIYDDTFVVLSWRPKGPCLVQRYYKGDSLGLFAPDHPVRTFAFKVATHRYFSRLLTIAIFANCITLALEKYEYDEYGNMNETDMDVAIAIFEMIFLVVYSAEMILKIIAKGFLFQRMAYLRNGWNLLDFIVVITNYLSYSLELAYTSHFSLEFEGTSFGFLRIFRVLRIVKTISILPGLRRIVTAILNSSKQLFEVMGLTVFTIMIFSLFGMEFFAGRFRQKCVKIKGALIEDFLPEVSGVTQGLSSFMTDRLYGMWVENEHNWLYRDKPDSEPVPCGNGSTARHCPEGYICLEVQRSLAGYNHGWMSFDNFFLAALQTLQVMTLDYWERIYELSLSTVGWEGTLYFVIVIFFGGFYLLNLMLAVVTLSYEKEQNILDVNKKNLNLTVPRRLVLTRKMSSFYFEHLNQQRLHLFEGFHEKSARERDELLLRMIKADEFAHPKMTGGQFDSSQQVSHAIYNMLGKVGRYVQSIKRSSEMDDKAIVDLNLHRTPIPEDGYYDEFYLFDGQSDAELANDKNPNCIKLKNGKSCNFNLIGFDQTFIVQDMSKFVKRPVKELQFDLFPPEDMWGSVMVWLSVWRAATQPIVEDWKWKNLMILFIFINTVISCFEYHQQPPWMDHLIHTSNDVFTYIFTVELLLKAIAYQGRFFEYGWNKFDLWVVVGSIMDNILQAYVGYKGLRGLKLLRILKLAQAWDTMKVLLNILFSAIGDMANLVGILFFVIYIFAMFGMQYIGRGYVLKEFNADYYPANYPRWAWQTSLHSFLMVFRVVSGEWVELTWECLAAYRSRGEEYKCFQTFLPMTVLGNFIVLNLFLALLLHIFDADEINSLSKSVKADRRERGNTFRGNMKRLWKTLRAKCSGSEEGKTRKRIKLSLNLKRNKVKPEIIKDSKADVAEGKVEAAAAEPTQGTSKTEVGSQKDEVVVNIDEEKEEKEKQFQIIIPRKLPKWRLYKVVTKYVEVGDHNEDDDVDDDLLEIPKHKRKGKEPVHETIDINTLSNLRFRQAIYKVLLLIRKEKARRLIQKYVSIKENQKKLAFLASVPSRASKLSGRSQVTIAAHNEKDDSEVSPCCHPAWYQTMWCLPCWFCGRWEIKCVDVCRQKVLFLVNHEYFEWTVLFLIIASSITLCFDDVHLEDSPKIRDFLFYSGAVFTGLFIVEFLLKIFAKGVYVYFTNAWSILDFFAVMVGVVSVIADIAERYKYGETHSLMSHMGALKTLRTLRCIRPLRTISRWHGMRIVVNSLLQAIPAIFNVFCVCLVFWLVFAIMGVQFFKGRFYKCVNHLGETVDHTIAPNKQVCCQKDRTHKFSWINSFPNFDSVPHAYLALLYLATFEGWMDVIRSGIDSRDVDQQPMRDYDMYAYIFFVMFCLFGGFLTTKLFIGVIIDNFNMLKKKFEGNLYEALMSQNQLKYFHAIKKLGRKRIRYVLAKPKNPARLAFFEIAISQRSEFFMFVIVVFNMIIMCCDGYGNQIVADTVLESLNAFFIFIYTLEAVVKLIGLGRAYFKSSWNVFDIIILAISAIDYAIGDLLSHNFPIPPSVVRLCRILRVGRVMRLMKSAKGIRRLVFALFVSIPALFNVAALLILVMFIYSILGMSLFGRAGYGGAFDELVNFETFPKAFLLLFRLITVAGWNDVLGTLMPIEAECGFDDDECGGEGQPDCDNISEVSTIIFVVTYLIITNFVIVNMYIAIILENFDQAVKEDDFEVTGDDIELFLDKWAVFDGEGTQFMELRYLAPFLDILEPPLRMSYPNQTGITALDIPIYQGGLIQIYDVMRNLIVFVMGNAEVSQMEEIQKIINSRFAENFRQKRIIPLVSTTRIWKVQHNAANTIQRHWKRYLRRHNRQPPPQVELVYNMESKKRT